MQRGEAMSILTIIKCDRCGVQVEAKNVKPEERKRWKFIPRYNGWEKDDQFHIGNFSLCPKCSDLFYKFWERK